MSNPQPDTPRPMDKYEARIAVLMLMKHEQWCDYTTTGACACKAGAALIDLLAIEREAANPPTALLLEACVDAHAGWYLYQVASRQPITHAREWVECEHKTCIDRRAYLAALPEPEAQPGEEGT